MSNLPLIAHVVHSLEGGGTERALLTLLHGLSPRRWRQAVVCLRGAGAFARDLPDHAACVPLDLRGSTRFGWIRLARVLRRLNPRIVHARNTNCWWDALCASRATPRTRLVLGFHGLEHDGPLAGRHVVAARLAHARGCDLATVSESGRRQLGRETGVPANRIAVLTNGVDLLRYHPFEAERKAVVRQELGIAPECFVVGTVGSLTPVKDHEALMRAFSRLSRSSCELRLLLVGDGPFRADLKELARVLGIAHQTIWTGWREDVPSLLNAMDAYVCSSISEGMSNAVLEAMACGLPIAATNVGDNGILIRQGMEGWLVPPRSPGVLAELLEALASNPQLRISFGQAARRRAREFSLLRMVRRYDAYYSRLICGQRGAESRTGFNRAFVEESCVENHQSRHAARGNRYPAQKAEAREGQPSAVR